MRYVTITKVFYPKPLQAEVIKVGEALAPIAENAEGNCYCAFMVNHEERVTVMVTEWHTDAQYSACTDLPQWQTVFKNAGDLFTDPAFRFEQQSYTRTNV